MTRTKTQGLLLFSNSGQKKWGHSGQKKWGQKKSDHQMATPIFHEESTYGNKKFDLLFFVFAFVLFCFLEEKSVTILIFMHLTTTRRR